MQVESSLMPDYCAVLVLRATREAVHRSVAALDELRSTARRPPHVYVDTIAAPASQHLKVMLSLKGYRPAQVSRVWAGPLPEDDGPTQLVMVAANRNDLGEWSALYSTGFGRVGSDEIADRVRWQTAFGSSAVAHWFIEERGHRIGVCQTCAAFETVGVYSFALLPRARGLSRHGDATRALARQLRVAGPRTFYFERLGSGRSRALLIPRKTGLRVVREFTVYAHDDN